jgi:oligosaccharide repeat unit polymerase
MKWQGLGFETALASTPLGASILCIVGGAKSSVPIRLLVLTMFCCSCGIVINRFRAGRAAVSPASTALVFAFVFWYAYPAVITYFVSGFTADMAVYSFANEDLVIKSIALLSLFLFSSVFMANLAATDNRMIYISQIRKEQSHFSVSSLFWLSIGVCVGGALPYFLSGFSLADIKSAIIESRAIEKPWLYINNLGNVLSPFTFIATSVMIAGAAALWLVAVDRKVKRIYRITSMMTAFLISSVLCFDTGTRANLALIFAPALLVLFIRRWKRSRLVAVCIIVVVVLSGLLLLQYVTLYRSAFTRDQAKNWLFKDWYTLGGTIDYFRENVFAVSIVPSGHDYFKESNVMQFIISPIPRFLWPAKPVSEVVRFYTLARWNIDILVGPGNTFPGIVGQYYMSWGWIGPIIIGLIFGLLARKLDLFIVPALRAGDIHKAGGGILVITWMFLCYRLLAPAYIYPIIIYSLMVALSRKWAPLGVIDNSLIKNNAPGARAGKTQTTV